MQRCPLPPSFNFPPPPTAPNCPCKHGLFLLIFLINQSEMASLSSSRESLLSQLFEPSPALAQLASSLPNDDLPTEQTIDFIRAKMLSLVDKAAAGSVDADRAVLEIINAHPRLGGQPGSVLSAHSHAEQARMAAASSAPGATSAQDEASLLNALQDEYERRFGMRYLVFVNGRPRDAIIADLRARMKGTSPGEVMAPTPDDVATERRTAVNATCDIALQRAEKMSSV